MHPLLTIHAGECARLHALAFAHGWSADDFESLIAAKTTIADAACLPAQFALSGFVVSRLAGDEAEILTVVVDLHVRRRGIANRLLACHLGNVAASGARRVFLEVEDTNHAALALYRRFAFAEVGRREAYYRKADGTRGSALIMRRDLA